MSDHLPTVEDKQGNQALDENVSRASSRGYAVTNGCRVKIATGDLAPSGETRDTVYVADGAVLVDGESHRITGEPTLSLQTASQYPRWDVIYVDDVGTVTVKQGTAEQRQPPDAKRAAVKRPAPPDLADEQATLLAKCWIQPGSDFLGADDILQERPDADHALHRTRAMGVLQRQSLPDGQSLTVPEDHVLDASPPYTLDGTLTLNGLFNL
jgi:hypothetical protein